MAILEQQRGALIFLTRTEGQRGAVAVGSGARVGGRDIDRAAELLSARADIERVQVLINGATDLGLGDDVQGVGRGVDDRRSRDTHFGGYVAAAEIGTAVDRAAARRNQTHLPVNCARIGVDGVDAVVLGGDVQHIVRTAAQGHVGDVQRLGINGTVHGDGEEFAERGAVHVGGRENGLRGVFTRARVVVVIGRNRYLRVQGHGGEETCRGRDVAAPSTQSHYYLLPNRNGPRTTRYPVRISTTEPEQSMMQHND
jgi:hypothetical protein